MVSNNLKEMNVCVKTHDDLRDGVEYTGKFKKVGKKVNFKQNKMKKHHRNPVIAETGAGKIWYIENVGFYRLRLNVTENELYSVKKMEEFLHNLLNKLEK